MKTSLTLENGTENSLSIPIDIIIEIFLRLSVKSIARCRCVSKLWASILSRPDFTELFLTRSLARPKLLFTCIRDCELFFFSSPQHQNPDDDEKSSPVVVNYHMKLSVNFHFQITRPVNGLICLRYWRLLNGTRNDFEKVLVIFNPSTGQSLPLPFPLPLPLANLRKSAKSFFGYDPINKQFKVLTSRYPRNSECGEHHILTLGSGNMSWRMVQCCIPHYSSSSEICINGVLYYHARRTRNSFTIVCFDFRSEEFRLIIRPAESGETLINYNGKLGLFPRYSYGSTSYINMWVLQDAEKQEWSKHTYVLPGMWQNIVGNTYLDFVGMTLTNEFVFQSIGRPFYVFIYNVERKTIKKVQMQGMEAFGMNKKIYTFQDHVEETTPWWASGEKNFGLRR